MSILIRPVPLIVWLGLAFVAAETIDFVTYLQSPFLESNPIPAMAPVALVLALKIDGVIAILLGAAILEDRGKSGSFVLAWAKAVLAVGTIIAVASVALNIASLNGWQP